MKKRILPVILSFCMVASSLSLPTGMAYASELSEGTTETYGETAVVVEETEEETTVETTEEKIETDTELVVESSIETVPETVIETSIEAELETEDIETFAASVTEETTYPEVKEWQMDKRELYINHSLSFTPGEPIYGVSTYGMDSILKSGNYAKWIDRINVPSYATSLYNNLVKASDNDGTEDWLIDVTKGKKVDAYTYGVSVTSFYIDANMQDAEIDAALDDKYSEITSYVFTVTDAFDCDHPEVFWLSGLTSTIAIYDGYISSRDEHKFTVYYTLRSTDPEYGFFDVREDNYQNTATIKSDITKRDQAVRNIVNGASGNYYEKVKYFNAWLTKQNAYLNGADNAASHECLSALLGSRGAAGPVCEGYARAFKVLCDKAYIPCTIITGNGNIGESSEAHMWNSVKLYSKWYAVDVTWNDPINFDGSDGDGTEDFLLVGSTTSDGFMTFDESHEMSNVMSENGIAFTNGPVLSAEAYVEPEQPCAHTSSEKVVAVKATLTKDGMAEEVCSICEEVLSTEAIPYPKTITLSYTSTTYNGKAQSPSVKVTGSDGKTIGSSNYTVTYKNHTNPGTATATVTFAGDAYTGSTNLNYTIKKANNTIKASNFTKTYATKTQTFYIKASVLDKAKLSYSSNNKNIKVDSSGKVTIAKKYIGKATITIKSAATSKYNAASKQITVTVNPTGTTLSGLTDSKDGKATVKWKKNTLGSGYQIQYATTSNFAKVIKTITVSKNKTTQTTLSGLAHNTKYYVRIRTYKTVSGTKYYSGWGGSKNISISLTPAKVNLSSVKNSSAGKVAVKWKKNSKASGYEIQYSTDSQFKENLKTVNVSSYKTTSKTIPGFAKGAKYYVRIRTYKTVGGKKYYAGWSSVKNIVITK